MLKKSSLIIIVLVSGLIYISSALLSRGIPEGYVIITQVQADDAVNISGSSLNKLDLQGAQIVSFNPDKPGSSINVLTQHFYSAISPELSLDNRSIVFAGRKEATDNWQIWMLNLRNSRFTQITNNNRDCFDPVFLPDERITFSCSWEEERYGSGSTLYTAALDGRFLNPITYHPHTDHSGTMLHDGRILFISEQVYPEAGKPKILALRPDGTKSGLFIQIPDGIEITGKVRENRDKQLFMTAINEESGNRSNVLRFSYNNPYNSLTNIYTSETGELHSLYPENSGDLLVSYRKNDAEPFGIFRLDPQGNPLPVHIDSEYHFLEPVIVEEKPFIPRKLPSALREARNFGIVVFVETSQALAESKSFEGEKVQVIGLDGLLDEFPVFEDGSFYVRMGARAPVRFQKLNSSDEILEGPTPWLWFMTGERRGFNSWDEKQLTAPANRVPEAINHSYIEISGFDTPRLVIKNDENLLSEAGHEY